MNKEVDIMAIMRVKMETVHFYISLGLVSCLHKFETKNYAWIQFHFYTSLK